MNSQVSKEIKVKVGISYLKDLSIENVNAPAIFTIESDEAPKIDINYDIAVARLPVDGSLSSFEVTLSITTKSTVVDKDKKEHVLFICEGKYSGIFHIEGEADNESEKRILFVYAPNVLFPFLRRIVATATGDCGFPPLMVDMIDFAAQFEQQYKKLQDSKEE